MDDWRNKIKVEQPNKKPPPKEDANHANNFNCKWIDKRKNSKIYWKQRNVTWVCIKLMFIFNKCISCKTKSNKMSDQSKCTCHSIMGLNP